MDDELLSALGRTRRDELAPPAEGEPVHTADAPLTSTERERVLAGVFARLDEGDAHREPSTAKVIAPSRWRQSALLGAVLAIAAALVLVIVRPGGSSDDLAPLPSFAITKLEGGMSSVRSEPGTGPLRLRSPKDEVEVVITPDARVHEALGVVVVARGADGSPRIATITAHVERSPDGAIRIRGPLDRFVRLAPGTWTLEWWVTRAGAEPRSLEALADADAARAWRSVTTEAIIAAD